MAATGPKFNKPVRNLGVVSKVNDLNSSDSFSNSQGYKTNNTPDNFKNKLQQKNKKSEFTSSVQEFLKQSTEIQDEIRKLSEICQQISPKFQESKVMEVSERIDWDKVNEVLLSLGYSSLETVNDEVPYEVLCEAFMQILNEMSNQKGILDQNKDALMKNEKEYEILLEENNQLRQKLQKAGPRKNFDSEIQELEKMTQEMEARFNKLKEKLKEKDSIIRELRITQGFSEKLSVNQENFPNKEKLKKIFSSFMFRECREKSKTDQKILAIIENYENKADSGQLQVVLDELEVFSSTEALSLIAKLKQEAFVFQETEKVVQELFYQLFTRPISGSFILKYESIFEEILSKVNDLVNTVKYLEEFKANMISGLGMKKSSGHSEVLEKIQNVFKIRKLFQISDDENEIQTIENLFFFVHEMKQFLKRLRTCVGKDLNLSELLEEVISRIV
jgi:hypothetical protein